MIEALGTKLVIERQEREQTTQGGIIVSNQQDQNPPAKILSIGDQVKIPVSIGDLVVVAWGSTAQVKHQGASLFIIDETGVFAKETQND